MGEAVASVSELDTEKTEPFPSSEYALRLHDFRAQGNAVASCASSSIHLDELVVPSDKDIRLLVRPLRSPSVSPGSANNCEWVALRTEVASPDEVTVLAVTQTSKDIKFTVHMPGEHREDGTPIPTLWCELYYDPRSDNQILVNGGDDPISLAGVHPSPPALTDGVSTSPGSPSSPSSPDTSVAQDVEFTVNPGAIRALWPGTWRIKIGHVDALDFRILERRRTVFKHQPLPLPSVDSTSLSGKRSFVADVDDDTAGPKPVRRPKTEAVDAPLLSAAETKENDGAVIMFLQPTTNPLVFPLPIPAPDSEVGRVVDSHALLDMETQDTVSVPGSCEIDSYTLTKHTTIASSSLSTVFKGSMNHPDVPPGSVITVKVIKTRSTPASTAANALVPQRPHEAERTVVSQANTWLREFQSHGYLQHKSIVRLYGGDARYLSLYMEHVDAKDLSKKGTWRATNSDYFTGNRHDALRIMRDITGALSYIHGLKLVHNDVKPANILYSRDRGAVLCDFGLSTSTDSPPSVGGTPYYVPPEFIGGQLRGPPSDVWALGITMLYVLRKISFPDVRGRGQHARPLYWMIADVNKASSSVAVGTGGRANAPPTLSAVQQMQMWLAEINDSKERLNHEDKLERLTYEMLMANRRQRITMKRVVSELFAETTA